ncbi:MAG TPA: YihY/virulence factor BrkB family protein [Ktedonobacterales bacterium]|jgi:membrane protein
MDKETAEHPTAIAPEETMDAAGSQLQNAETGSGSQLVSSPPAAHAPHPSGLRAMMATVGGFWAKLNNDWIFNLAGLLAYNFLMALFPLLLLFLAGCGLALDVISPATEAQIQRAIADALPGNTGTILIQAVSAHLKKSAGLLFVVGLVAACIAGSRLFVTLEGCFGVVFRLRGRDPVRQNRMAFGMLVLYLLVAPVVLLISILPAGLISLVDPDSQSFLSVLLSDGARLLIWFGAGMLFFGVTYMLVPHRRREWRRWRANWKGTLVASVLLVLYEGLFRLYQQYLLHADNYGTIAAFALVILLFLYYLAFILLLGAEINSWTAGQRETAADIPGVLHAVQAHATVRGAAGATAGMPQEEMQRHTRSRLMRYIEAALRRRGRGR